MRWGQVLNNRGCRNFYLYAIQDGVRKSFKGPETEKKVKVALIILEMDCKREKENKKRSTIYLRIGKKSSKCSSYSIKK